MNDFFRIKAKALVEAGSMYPRLKPGVFKEEMQGQVGVGARQVFFRS